jgi:uncharacterized damage-inducible protein DinB
MTPEQGKVLFNVFAGPMKNETEATKKVIRAVPEDKKTYKPDPKAKSAHELAWHIATSEVWFLDFILTGKADMGAEPPPPPPTIAAILEWYQTNYEDRVNKLREMPSDKLAAPLNLFGAMELPAVEYLNMLNLHSAHHRGQLSTYLRPMGSKVPSIYGGSADEPYQPPQ